MARVARTVSEFRRARRELGTVAFVPTMGALHEGHIALVNRAALLAESVVVSIFVNPLQFGEKEDLGRYPRDLEGDLNKLPEKVLAFAPDAEELYPEGDSETRISAGAAGETFEGASRPGHFDGMLTVVAKLFNIVEPQFAVFGQKDAQQVFLVRRMVRDLNFDLEIDVVETVREPDGLALSSRNRFLSGAERSDSLALSRALRAAQSAATSRNSAMDAARGILDSARGIDLDYFELVDPKSFRPIASGFKGEATAIVAAKLGSTRLIDNAPVVIG
ncbi:MAG: pantoate--beta-alanine ligase [Cryobacterium sp.]|nr:pantoate--beta-alanine ligase [Cryobacterium sp.]